MFFRRRVQPTRLEGVAAVAAIALHLGMHLAFTGLMAGAVLLARKVS